MKWIIRELESKLEDNEEVLCKYKILGSKIFTDAAQKCVDDLTKAISILKAENNTGS